MQAWTYKMCAKPPERPPHLSIRWVEVGKTCFEGLLSHHSPTKINKNRAYSWNVKTVWEVTHSYCPVSAPWSSTLPFPGIWTPPKKVKILVKTNPFFLSVRTGQFDLKSRSLESYILSLRTIAQLPKWPTKKLGHFRKKTKSFLALSNRHYNLFLIGWINSKDVKVVVNLRANSFHFCHESRK